MAMATEKPISRRMTMTTTNASTEAPDLRELSAAEMGDIAGGAIKLDFEFLGLRIFIGADDYYAYMCVADSQTYSCAGMMSNGTPISGSGPVPQ
jgi:hypothetical protein